MFKDILNVIASKILKRTPVILVLIKHVFTFITAIFL